MSMYLQCTNNDDDYNKMKSSVLHQEAIGVEELYETVFWL